jgi:hypothetical protein
MARKTGYKQGAMSATDAVSQLQAASGKCDFKWMKAHAASARFFGAREADVKKALSKCPSKRSGMMGVYEARDARASVVGNWFGKPSRLEVREHDGQYLIVLTHEAGDSIVQQVGPAYPTERAARAEQRKRARRLLNGKSEALKGVRGTPAQHAAAAELSLANADDELAWLRYKKCRTVKGKKVCKSPHSASEKKRLRRKVDRLLDTGATECWWTQGEEKARCEAEVRRLDAKFAKSGMGVIRSRGVPRGGCVYVVEAGKKRKVTSDLASAKSAAKRMAQRGAAKVTKACSRGRGSDSGEVVARCTPRGCTDARGRALAGRRKRK